MYYLFPLLKLYEYSFGSFDVLTRSIQLLAKYKDSYVRMPTNNGYAYTLYIYVETIKPKHTI